MRSYEGSDAATTKYISRTTLICPLTSTNIRPRSIPIRQPAVIAACLPLLLLLVYHSYCYLATLLLLLVYCSYCYLSATPTAAVCCWVEPYAELLAELWLGFGWALIELRVEPCVEPRGSYRRLYGQLWSYCGAVRKAVAGPFVEPFV